VNRGTGSDRLIVALDMDGAEARAFARQLAGTVRWLKVGMTLFYQAGPGIVSEFRDMGFDVFVDLKLHDIPHQVRGASDVLARLGAGMMTVHASGAPPMVEAAVEGAAAGAQAAGVGRPAVLAVTVLTSIDDDALATIGVERGAADHVRLLAGMARAAGADGVVCSPLEARAIRQALGAEPLVVTPGVRPSGGETGDQARIATPLAAITAGASHVVVGRPITGASDPVEAAARIAAELEEGRSE
jgi:orotidine-5'-phosphate decarboxylase